MIIELDVSKGNFEQVDTSEAYTIFDATEEISENLSIKVWGLNLIYTFGKERLDVIPKYEDLKNNIYIAGFATFTFTNISNVILEVALFREQSKEFLLDVHKKLIYLKRIWKMKDETEGYSYEIGGCLHWPKGSCELEILCLGSVKLQFDTEDCITAKEYIENPGKYSIFDKMN